MVENYWGRRCKENLSTIGNKFFLNKKDAFNYKINLWKKQIREIDKRMLKFQKEFFSKENEQ